MWHNYDSDWLYGWQVEGVTFFYFSSETLFEMQPLDYIPNSQEARLRQRTNTFLWKRIIPNVEIRQNTASKASFECTTYFFLVQPQNETASSFDHVTFS